MTETEWLDCEEPRPMLYFLHGKASERKLRLFAIEGCRRVWHLLIDERSRRAVELAEWVADGLSTELTREIVELAARAVISETRQYRKERNPTPDFETAAMLAAGAIRPQGQIGIVGALFAVAQLSTVATKGTSGLESEEAEMKRCAMIIRELFPFHPITLDPNWLTSTVVSLVQQMYDTRDFSAMPILADALQDAGCDNENVLKHCRQPGEHTRGCWLVDLLLGFS